MGITKNKLFWFCLISAALFFSLWAGKVRDISFGNNFFSVFFFIYEFTKILNFNEKAVFFIFHFKTNLKLFL